MQQSVHPNVRPPISRPDEVLANTLINFPSFTPSLTLALKYLLLSSTTTPQSSIFPNQRTMSNLWYQAAFILAIIMLRFLIQRYNDSQPKVVISGKKSN